MARLSVLHVPGAVLYQPPQAARVGSRSVCQIPEGGLYQPPQAARVGCRQNGQIYRSSHPWRSFAPAAQSCKGYQVFHSSDF
jgi:hypothetical protein